MFSPEDLALIKDGPSERRRFLDIAISQIRPSYFYDLQTYNKILYQRNALLKEIRNKKELINTIDIWNTKIIESGVKIIKVRIEYLKRIEKIAKEIHLKLTENSEILNISYNPSFILNNEDTSILSKDFKEILEKNLDKDIRNGITSVGPNRDDISFFINSSNIKQFGSQGQQRTAVLSIKLSIIDIIKEEIGETPILLLDDVMSELDNKRQNYLLESIKEIQTIITCTEKGDINKNLDSLNLINTTKFINVISGNIF
jgi:DNA replication and repair protein RecF